MGPHLRLVQTLSIASEVIFQLLLNLSGIYTWNLDKFFYVAYFGGWYLCVSKM